MERTTFDKVKEAYFRSRDFEGKGGIYESLGVKFIQKMVMNTAGKIGKMGGLHRCANTYFLADGRSLVNLETYRKGTRLNETLHGIQIPLNLLWIAGYLADEKYVCSGIWAGFLVLNASMVMLQRYNRARVEKVIERRLNRVGLESTMREHWSSQKATAAISEDL